MKREYTNDMDEISGFGGGYEDTCRTMVLAGCEWFDKHPQAEPKFHSYKDVTGLIIEDNGDAKALLKTISDAMEDCTGAMVHAAISHIMYIKNNGWEKYVECMINRKNK